MRLNMGMRIGSAGSVAGSQDVGAGQWKQRQQGVKDLMSALSSGDIGAAQKAYSGLAGANGAASAASATSPARRRPPNPGRRREAVITMDIIQPQRPRLLPAIRPRPRQVSDR